MSSSIQKGQSSETKWSAFAPYLVPPVAASAAIIPVFYGFVAKSAKQMGEPIPQMGFKAAVQGGLKASPTIGVIVGTQMGVQNIVEQALMKGSESNAKPNSLSMLVSSVVVGAVSAPALAVFNGQTMGRGVKESLKLLSAKQTAAIVARETSFLFSLRVSGPVSEVMKQYLGENKLVEYSSGFCVGAIGSVVGHPADTALTCWQKDRVIAVRQLMRGALTKSATVGAFTVFYMMAKDALKSMS